MSQRKSLGDLLSQILPKPKLTKYIPQMRTEKQEAFLCLECLEAFYGGAAGGAKSWALLMGSLQYVDVPGYSALLIRRTSPELTAAGGLIDIAKEWLTDTDAQWNGSLKRWTFPTGGKPATLDFAHYEAGVKGQQKKYGGQYQYIGVDELTEFQESEYRFLWRSLRKPEGMAVPLRMRSGSNPIGVGAPFVKQRFVVSGNVVIKEKIAGQMMEYERRFIPAKLDDNPYIDRASYIQSLGNMEPYLLQALLDGDWDAKPPGKMFMRGSFKIVPVAPASCWWVRFWDLAATPEDAGGNPSWTVGLKLGTDGSGLYHIADVRRDRLAPAGVKDLVKQTAEVDGPDVPIFIEQEGGSSGKTVIDDYVKAMPAFSVQGRRPTGPKTARAVPVANQAGAGNIRLVQGPWNGKFLDEIEQVPSKVMDQCDALSGAYNELVSGSWSAHEEIVSSYGSYDQPDW